MHFRLRYLSYNERCDRWITLCLNGSVLCLGRWNWWHLRLRCLKPCSGFVRLCSTYSQFQQDTMASQIRYFKTRYQQLRHLVERFKRDVADLKKYNHIDNGTLKIHLWLLTSELTAFFKAKTTNFECKWVKDMMIRFLPALSIRTESVRWRRTSNFLHSLCLIPRWFGLYQDLTSITDGQWPTRAHTPYLHP